MVSKASSRIGSVRAIDYILSDKKLGKAQVLDMQGIIGQRGKEILSEFRFIQQTNKRCHNNTISLIISPSPEDAVKLTKGQLKEILHKQLQHLGLSDHQYISTVHRSTDKPHIHAIINRIHPHSGKALDDSFLSKKAQAGAEEIAISLGLHTAKQVQEEKKFQKRVIKEKIIKRLKKGDIKSWENFTTVFSAMGMKIEVVESKVQNKTNGFKINGFKASEIDRSLTLNRIDNTLKNYLRTNRSQSVSR